MTGTFEIYRKIGEYRWRLRHRNGRVLAESAKAYTKKSDAKRAAKSAKVCASGETTFRSEG